MRFWRKRKLGIEGNIIADSTYLLNYRRHYDPIFRSLEEPLLNSVLAELFLFRAWTTQYAYRMFSDASAHDDLITETVSSCSHLGTGIFEKTLGFSIEAELGKEFIELVEDRWSQYDDIVVNNKDSETAIPAGQLCGKLFSLAGVADLEAYAQLCTDFLSQVQGIRDNCLANDLFKPGRR